MTSARAIAFIDANIEDYSTLAAGVRAGIEVAMLHPAEDGIAQITSILAERSEIYTVHIISHGSPGCLYLGNTVLNLENLQDYASELTQWANALVPNAEILIYGCNFASSASSPFIQKLHHLTNAKIAASCSRTGNVERGGNWNLEVRTHSQMSAPVVFPAAIRQSYTGVFAPGDRDTSFGIDGLVTTDFGRDDIAYELTLQPDGKIVLVGETGDDGFEERDFALARYNSDGSLDASFGTGGKVTTNFERINFPSLDVGTSIALQPDGKLVVAGISNFDLALARYNSDGSLDASFGTGGKVADDLQNLWTVTNAADVVLQPDGKILVASQTDGDFALVRYNNDGSLDTSFGIGGQAIEDFGGNDISTSIVLQVDGKILTAVITLLDDLTDELTLVRYNSDGSPDTSFGTGGTVTANVGSFDWDGSGDLTLQPDGKIAIVLRTDNGLTVARYNSDGSPDTSFGTNGQVKNDFNSVEPGNDFGIFAPGNAIASQADGKLVISGIGLVRYNSDGSLDTSFGTNGVVTNGNGSAVAIQPDGKILGVGAPQNTTDFDFILVRHEATGDIVPSPDPLPEPTPPEIDPEPDPPETEPEPEEPNPNPDPEIEPTPEPEPEPVPEPTPTPFPEDADPNYDACQLVNHPPIFPSANTTNDTRTGASLLGDDNANTLDATGETQGFILADAGDDNLLGSPGNDRLFGNQGRDFINAGTGDDIVRAGKDNDGVLGGDGNDVISGGLGNDRILSGDGNDVVFGNAGIEYIDAGLGNDLVFGGRGNDGIDGGDGDDVLLGELGNDCLHGFSGNDLLFGNAGEDVLLGSLGSDLLSGGRGNDSLSGGFQSDVLRGDLGDDTLSGGEGGDRFDFRLGDGSDIITDFEDGVDIIGLQNGLTFAQLTISQVGSNTQISVGDEVLVSLLNVNATAIDIQDVALV